jgi:hypothetical protein
VTGPWASWEECLDATRTRCATPRLEFTPQARTLVRRLDTPEKMQAWLNGLPYNWERGAKTMRTLRGVVRTGKAHCLEAVLAAAAILEQHGHAPIFLDLDSEDGLGHVLLLFRRNHKFGCVARSRDPGLHGRRPLYPNLRSLVQSFAAPYIDATGCIRAYGLLDLRRLRRPDWRLSPGNVWRVERAMLDPRRPGLRRFRVSKAYRERWRRRYLRFMDEHPGERPVFYDRRAWMGYGASA